MKPVVLICALLAIGLGGGCSKDGNTSVRARQAVHQHEHYPPHGGVPVVLGNEEFHVEFVLDARTGRLRAYFLDGELENFVRVAMPSFEITAQVAGREEHLIFAPVANNATGETVGDTALFEVQSDWLKTTPRFDAVIKELTVGGDKYQNITFNFPKGNDTDENEK